MAIAAPTQGFRTQCNVCGASFDPVLTPLVRVRSNIRKFRAESFNLWRCPGCRCIHCHVIVDLPRYYEGYGTSLQKLNFFTRIAYSRLLARFRAAGLTRSHRFLDYGCGSGNLVMYLKQRGYRNAVGFDPYGRPNGFGDRNILQPASNDFVCMQDVIEHVEDGGALLAEAAALLRPGGVLYVGTPSADEIDLADTHKHLHQLHQPYHLHIYTRDALVKLGASAGLKTERTYRRFYGETPLFAMNEAFCRRYLERIGDDIEALLDPPRIGMILSSPSLLFHGTFGYLYSPAHSVTVVYRRTS